MIDGQGRFQQTCRARAGFQVADVTLSGAEGDAVRRRAAKDGLQAFHFDHIADARAGPVGFDEGGRGRVQPGVFPGAGHCQLLSDGVGGGDALAFAIAGTADAANDGVNAVSVSLGVRQPFQQEGGRAFAHDEAICAIAEGAGSRGAERADFAEFDVAGNIHVAVHAAGEDGVHLALDEHGKSRFHGGEAGGAGGVGDEVGTAQVEDVGDAPGDDVGQFARHGVLGDGGDFVGDGFLPAVQNFLLRGAGQAVKGGDGFQRLGVFGQDDAGAGEEDALAAHGRAQNDGGAFGVQGAFRVAVVGEGVGGDGHGPLLPFVHGVGHFGGHTKAPPIKRKPAHPTADFAVRFVRGVGVGIVVMFDAPPVGGDFGDAVLFVDDVVPEGGSAEGIGHDGANAHDGYGCIR